MLLFLLRFFFSSLPSMKFSYPSWNLPNLPWNFLVLFNFIILLIYYIKWINYIDFILLIYYIKLIYFPFFITLHEIFLTLHHWYPWRSVSCFRWRALSFWQHCKLTKFSWKYQKSTLICPNRPSLVTLISSIG